MTRSGSNPRKKNWTLSEHQVKTNPDPTLREKKKRIQDRAFQKQDPDLLSFFLSFVFLLLSFFSSVYRSFPYGQAQRIGSTHPAMIYPGLWSVYKDQLSMNRESSFNPIVDARNGQNDFLSVWPWVYFYIFLILLLLFF